MSVRDGEGPLFWYGKQVIEADPAGLRAPCGHGARAARRRGLWLRSFGVGEGVLARGGPRRHHVVLLLFHLYDHYCYYYLSLIIMVPIRAGTTSFTSPA